MARYIDADKAIENIKLFKFWDRLSPYEKGVNFAVNSICRELADVTITPTADVAEVVRCENCAFYDIEDYNCREFDCNMPCDGYCSKGTPKERGVEK